MATTAMEMKTTKVRFALKAPAAATAGKRKRPLSPFALEPQQASPSHAPTEQQQLRQLVGCFNTLDEEDADTTSDQQRHLTKQPRLQLEDARAKAKRLQDEGSTLAESGRFRAAMARWFEAIDVDPSNAVAFELLAQASMALCEDFRAIQFALRATELAPAWGDAFLTLARCHLNFGELELALQHINKVSGRQQHSNELVIECSLSVSLCVYGAGNRAQWRVRRARG